MSSAFDLSTLNSNSGSVLEIRHPVSGEVLKTPDSRAVSITLFGLESEASQKAQREAQRRRLKRAHQHKVTPEELEAEALNLLAAVTASWIGIGLGDEELECTPDNVKRVYREIPWIRKQVDEFITDISNFMGK